MGYARLIWFTLAGAVVGFLLMHPKLMAARLESQRHHVALETLQELMVTLAHHIRNANVVIGGFSSRVIKNLPDPAVQRQLQLIQQASRSIEAVIASLESLSQVNHARYISEWETRMIDLKQELEARLAAFEPSSDVS